MTADTELLRAAAAVFVEPFAGVLRIEPEGGAPFWIDGRVRPPKIDASPPAHMPPDGLGLCAWVAARDTVMRILEEERILSGSFVSGGLTVAGDVSVVARLRLGAPHG